MPIFSYIRKMNKCTCLLFRKMNDWQWIFGIYSQFGLSSNHLCKKNWTIPYFLILISNRANFSVSGLSSFQVFALDLYIGSFLFFPVHGNWAGWESWGACSVSCGVGLQKRFRTCSNPTPSISGRPCIGAGEEGQRCTQQLCPGNVNHLEIYTAI